MAYIYEFSFLCESLDKARRLQWYFTDSTVRNSFASGLTHLGKVGNEDCRIFVESHRSAGGNDSDDLNLQWVSVVPFDGNSIKWGSGEPDDKKAAKKFENEILDMIMYWPDRLDFIYASAGVEITGFRNREEIVELVKENDTDLSGSLINESLWKEAGSPDSWVPQRGGRLYYVAGITQKNLT